MKTTLITLLLVVFIVVSGQAQSLFKFLTWDEERVLNDETILITRVWKNPDGDQMYTILVNADITRKGVLHINSKTRKVDTYSLAITGVEVEFIGNLSEIKTLVKVKEFVWQETLYNDAVDLMKIDNSMYANFYDLDSPQE